jgi:hypothetical protein
VSLQAFAPGSVRSSRQRVLLLFVCTNPECCTGKIAFTAARCQLQEQPQSARAAQSVDKTHVWGQVNWGTPADVDRTIDQAPTGFDDLLAQMDVLSASPSAPVEKASDAAQPIAATGDASHNEVRQHSIGAVLPAFHVHFESASASHAGGIDSAHVQQLLEEYEQSQGQESRGYGSAALGGESSDGGVVEEYEKTDAYTRFLEKLSQQPSQCARYAKHSISSGLSASIALRVPLGLESSLGDLLTKPLARASLMSSAAQVWKEVAAIMAS